MNYLTDIKAEEITANRFKLSNLIYGGVRLVSYSPLKLHFIAGDSEQVVTAGNTERSGQIIGYYGFDELLIEGEVTKVSIFIYHCLPYRISPYKANNLTNYQLAAHQTFFFNYQELVFHHLATKHRPKAGSLPPFMLAAGKFFSKEFFNKNLNYQYRPFNIEARFTVSLSYLIKQKNSLQESLWLIIALATYSELWGNDYLLNQKEFIVTSFWRLLSHLDDNARLYLKTEEGEYEAVHVLIFWALKHYGHFFNFLNEPELMVKSSKLYSLRNNFYFNYVNFEQAALLILADITGNNAAEQLLTHCQNADVMSLLKPEQLYLLIAALKLLGEDKLARQIVSSFNFSKYLGSAYLTALALV
ncbi:MAG: hypothetical protein FWE37_04435 [Spirochaetaceae bacterium]|nr:hypothetical protein [Spirochaetaceae bacterium]